MNVGSIFVSVLPDTSKFRGQLVRELRPLVAAAERQVGQIKITAVVDSARARRELQALASEAHRVAGTAKVDVEADTSGVQNDVRQAVAQAERKGPIKLDVEVSRGALAGVGAIFAAFSLRDITQAALGATALASAAQPAASALAALATAGLGATAALSPLVGLFPALAVGAGSLAQGVGVAAGALSGIGAALKAYQQRQTSAASSALSNASAARAAARAQRAAAESVVAANDRVESAERDLTRSQEAAKRAQDDLNEARREAKEELEDLQLAVERSGLNEERAHLRLAEARRRLARVRVLDATSGGRASAELRDATLDVKDAELSVREAVERRGDEQERLNKLNSTGIDGSERVIAAQLALHNANERVTDSQRAIAAAHKAVARAHEDVADAAERTQEASIKAAGGVDKFAEAMNDLSPAGRSFVQTLLSFEAPLKRLRDIGAENMFPGLERGLNAARPLFAVFEPIVAATARTLGNLGERLGVLLASPFFSSTFTTLGGANVRILESLGNAALVLAPAIAQILVAAAPLAEAMARLAESSSRAFASFIDGQSASGGLAGFFTAAERSLRLLWGVLRPFIGVMFGLGRAASETGRFILEGLGGSLDELSDKVNSPEGQRSLEKFFTSFHPAIVEGGRLLADLGRMFIDFAQNPNLAPLLKQIREELLPAIRTLADKATEMAPTLITLFTRLVTLLSILPVKPILDMMVRVLDVFIAIAQSPIGGELLKLQGIMVALRLAGLVLGLALGPVFGTIALAALIIAANWDKVGPVFEKLRDVAVGALQYILNTFLGWSERFLSLATRAFSWVPGIGPKLEEARDAVAQFRDNVNTALEGIKDKKITITADARQMWAELERIGAVGNQYAAGAQRRANEGYYGPAYHTGMDRGPIRGRPGEEVPIRAQAGEWVVTPEQMRELRRGGDGASAPSVTHNWTINAIPERDLTTELPRRLRMTERMF